MMWLLAKSRSHARSAIAEQASEPEVTKLLIPIIFEFAYVFEPVRECTGMQGMPAGALLQRGVPGSSMAAAQGGVPALQKEEQAMNCVTVSRLFR